MKKIFYILIAAVSICALASCGSADKDNYAVIRGYAQGGVYSVTMNLRDVDVELEIIRDSIQSILDEIDVTLSGYNRNSMLSRFNAGEDIVPNKLFLDVESWTCPVLHCSICGASDSRRVRCRRMKMWSWPGETADSGDAGLAQNF